MNKYIVYKHENLINHKVYIGITCNYPKRRWKAGSGYKHNDYFYKSIKKYGWDNFKHDVLYENLTKEQAEEIEIDLIKKYDSTNKEKGYNIHTGGNSRLGQSMPKGYDSPKHRVVEQYDIDGNFIREYGGLRQVQRETGWNHKTIQHCCVGDCKSAHGYQWKYKDDDKEITPVTIGQYHKPNTVLYHPVICVETGKLYPSIKHAIEETGVKNISSCCRGVRKTAGNFHWQYAEKVTI